MRISSNTLTLITLIVSSLSIYLYSYHIIYNKKILVINILVNINIGVVKSSYKVGI